MLTNPAIVYVVPPHHCAGEYQRVRPILISKGEESKAGHIWKPQSAFEYHHIIGTKLCVSAARHPYLLSFIIIILTF